MIFRQQGGNTVADWVRLTWSRLDGSWVQSVKADQIWGPVMADRMSWAAWCRAARRFYILSLLLCF